MVASLFAAATVLITAAAMEAVAWATHKYLMHGPGWAWHASHHAPRRGRWEKNDLYGLIFAALACGLMGLGTRWPVLYWVGLGMSAYGLLYLVVHDGLVHRRWPLPWTPRHPWLRHLIRAHRRHHATRDKDGAVFFGFLYASPLPQRPTSPGPVRREKS